MSDRFKALECKTFRSYVELMQSLQEAGFTSEFDNSLIMREINARIDNIWKSCKTQSGVYVRTSLIMDHAAGPCLVVNLVSSVAARAQETIILMVRPDGSLAIASNALCGEPVNWDNLSGAEFPLFFGQVEKHGVEHVFTTWKKLKDKIPHTVPDSVRALFDSLSPKDHPNQCRVNLSCIPGSKLTAQYYVAGKEVASLEFSLFPMA